MNKLGFAVCAALLASSGVAHAAPQCFGDEGTFGAVSVTFSAGCGPRNQIYQASTTAFYVTGNNTCVLTFSKPLATSSFTVDLGNIDTSEVTAVSTNNGAYSVQMSDLSTSPLFTNEPLAAGASEGNIVNPTGPTAAAARFQFVSAPPPSISSLTLAHTASGGLTTVYQVCADDADAASPEPVPTLSEWAMILLGTILAGGAALHLQRRRHGLTA